MTYTETATTFATATKFNLIKRVLRLDASFREADQLKKTEARNLEDMGVMRQQANTGFHRQFAEKRY
ncbi:MAG: hypothetical protein AAED33_01935 [Paracoccaceae bacterium]